MTDALRLAAAFGAAAGLALVLVPAARLLALRLDFVDRPRGYRAHRAPTPYLGGLALLVAFLPVALVLGDPSAHAVVLVAAVGLGLLGTLDDRRPVPPLVRVVAELAAATALWAADLGWSVTSVGVLDLALTCLWVVGLVNAFNLMDNMDGAAASVTLACACGIAALAASHDQMALGVLALAVAGACTGFLPFNLASPARIFLGDGGSMWLGFVVAAVVMAVSDTAVGGGLHPFVVAGLIVAVPALDTALVVVSRIRRGISILTGGRDHLTHRLRIRLPSARAVALALALGQGLLAGGALMAAEASPSWVAAIAGGGLLAAIAVLAHLESGAWSPDVAARVTAESAGPQHQPTGERSPL